MKKTLFFSLLVLFFTGSHGNDQSYYSNYFAATAKGKGILRNAFMQGQTAVHAGASFISLQYPSHDDYLIYGKVSSDYQMPINIRVDYALTDKISIGAFVNKFSASTTIKDRTNDLNTNGFNYKSLTLGLSGAFHAYMGKNTLWLDPYVQGMVGAHILSSKPFGDNNYFDPQKGGFAYSFDIGANVYFFQPLGFYVEVGYGVNVINTGLTLRF